MIPEGLTDGQAFDALATVVIRGDKLVLVKLDGHTIEGYDKMADKLDRGESAEDEQSKPMKDQLESAFAQRRGY